MFPTNQITTAVAFALGLGFTSAATAQMETAPGQLAPAAPEAAPAASYDDATIEAFAVAVMKVTEVQNKYGAQIESVTEETEKQSLLEDANAEIVASIEDSENLTVDQYLEIAEAASEDQQLNLRIAQRLQDMQTEQPG